MKKRFYGASFISVLSNELVFWPYLLCIIFILDQHYFELLLIPIFSYFMYFAFGKTGMGIITIKDNQLFISGDFVPPSFRFQHKVDLSIQNIESIEFIDITSPSYPYWTLPFLRIYLSDYSKITINLTPFSKKQWKALEKVLIECNSNLVILKSAEDLIQFRKHH